MPTIKVLSLFVTTFLFGFGVVIYRDLLSIVPLVPLGVRRKARRIAYAVFQRSSGLKTNEATTTQFKKEAILLGKMSHPALPKIFDYGQQDGHHYLIMEYIPGHDLEDWIKKYGPVKERQALLWVDQLLDALIYMHSKQPVILHRDIKPANIKLVDDNNNLIKLVELDTLSVLTE